MQRLSYLTETVLSNKITWNRIVLSFKDRVGKPLRRWPSLRDVYAHTICSDLHAGHTAPMLPTSHFTARNPFFGLKLRVFRPRITQPMSNHNRDAQKVLPQVAWIQFYEINATECDAFGHLCGNQSCPRCIGIHAVCKWERSILRRIKISEPPTEQPVMSRLRDLRVRSGEFCAG